MREPLSGDILPPLGGGTALADPAMLARNQAAVEAGFWAKFKRLAARLSFSHDLLAAYFCAFDRDTPVRVRAILLAALAYFVLPTDAIPDIIAGLGFTDDATVLATVIGIVSAHIRPSHRNRAADVLADWSQQP
jgi:uncharacterized membrane protein YkvA (DUF1232 family)